MIYGQDDPMLFPVADLYDSGMMNMYINAAREQYNQNREDMKDFMKTYGDFISPISADMDWVDQQTRGRINDALNYLQQNGIDPLRSAEGRAIIQRVIRDTPTAGINARRQSAENAKEYLKNKAALERQGLYNPNFESYRLGGNTINNWNTGDNGIWQETSPFEYKDLNEYTGHIFDKMEDEFISSDGIYDYTGVSRERRNQALTQQIGGLLGTPLGRFHYENSRANAAAILGREPTEEEVLNQFKDDILTATVEYERRNRKENPEYARQRDFYYDDKLDAAKTARDIDAYRQKEKIKAQYGGGYGGKNLPNNEQYSFAEVVRRRAATSIMGQQIQEYSQKTLDGIRDKQMQFGEQVSKTTNGHSWNKSGVNAYKNMYGNNYYLEDDISKFLNYQMYDKNNKTMILPKEQISRLYDEGSVISHTAGFRGKATGTNRNSLKSADLITITPTRRSYGAFMKDDRHKNYFEVTVVTRKKDKDGNYVPTGSKTMYLDSHITSVANAPGSGSLGVRDRRNTNKVYPLPKGIQTTDTQDTRYQDAIIGDKIATDAIIKGTVYGSDATLSELPNYAQ